MQAVANMTYGCHQLLEPARLISFILITDQESYTITNLLIASFCAIPFNISAIKPKNIHFHNIFEYYSPIIIVESTLFPIFVADY